MTDRRAIGYLCAIGAVGMLLTMLVAVMIRWDDSNPVVACLWVGGLFLLLLNVAYMLVMWVCSFFVALVRLPETDLEVIPSTAILYVVKNEGPTLRERMVETFVHNQGPNVHLWLISNSDDPTVVAWEEEMIAGLQQQFGEGAVLRYEPHDNPLGRKHVALRQWSRDHPEYSYMMVCDADTVLARGAVARLAAKAEHPDNRHFAVFQAHLAIRWSTTRFARYLEPGQNVVQKAFCRVNQHMLGRSPFYGHAALIRRTALARVDVPDRVLSHDLWDAVELDRAGGATAFCEDVEAYEMLPSDYLEFRRRNRRWILGNLEALPLLFVRGLSAGGRFYVFVAIFMYLVQPVLLLWVLLGLLAHNQLSGSLIATQSVLLGGASVVDLEMSGVCVATIGFVWLHKLRFAGSAREVAVLAREVLITTALLLNGLFYDSVVILLSPWLDRSWRPMAKRSSRDLRFAECFAEMLPSTCFGAVLLAVGVLIAPKWALLTSPILASFLLGSVFVYTTAKDGGATPLLSRDQWDPVEGPQAVEPT
ncbi:MAG: glycosyltransferase [Deltaproteobacteria bacterium]|nr:glycosyltransferase [Deltaproteobacteria bacterium]